MTSEDEITEVPGETQYKPKTDDEIKQLAIDVHAGKVFGTWNIHNPRDTPMVFMILALMQGSMLKQMERDGIVHMYEYLDKAGPRSINGMPCFFSAYQLNADDSNRLDERIKKIQAALDSIDE